MLHEKLHLGVDLDLLGGLRIFTWNWQMRLIGYKRLG